MNRSIATFLLMALFATPAIAQTANPYGFSDIPGGAAKAVVSAVADEVRSDTGRIDTVAQSSVYVTVSRSASTVEFSQLNGAGLRASHSMAAGGAMKSDLTISGKQAVAVYLAYQKYQSLNPRAADIPTMSRVSVGFIVNESTPPPVSGKIKLACGPTPYIVNLLTHKVELGKHVC